MDTEPMPNTKLAEMMRRAGRSNKGLAADVRAVATCPFTGARDR